MLELDRVILHQGLRRWPARLHHFWLQARHGRGRADELLFLFHRFKEQPALQQHLSEKAHTAQKLAQLRQAIFTALGQVHCCKTCARHHPPPNGTWDGGFCCGGSTTALFSTDEIAALHAAGARPRHYHPPRGTAQAGCAFRGPRGCSLAPYYRPTICLTYLCADLTQELHARGDLPLINEHCQQAGAIFAHFKALRSFE